MAPFEKIIILHLGLILDLDETFPKDQVPFLTTWVGLFRCVNAGSSFVLQQVAHV